MYYVIILLLLANPLWPQDVSGQSGETAEDKKAPDENAEPDEESAAEDGDERDLPTTPWALTLYGAFQSSENIGWTLLPPTDLEAGHGLIAGALSRRMMTILDRADVELEGQLVKHFGSGTGEINFTSIGRWIRFPWNDKLPTTIALGLGLSYATDIPAYELITHGNETGKFLTYVLFEGTLSHPNMRHWEFVYRIHHRSGFFGLFGGVTGASNAIGFGTKYRW